MTGAVTRPQANKKKCMIRLPTMAKWRTCVVLGDTYILGQADRDKPAHKLLLNNVNPSPLQWLLFIK